MSNKKKTCYICSTILLMCLTACGNKALSKEKVDTVLESAKDNVHVEYTTESETSPTLSLEKSGLNFAVNMSYMSNTLDIYSVDDTVYVHVYIENDDEVYEKTAKCVNVNETDTYIDKISVKKDSWFDVTYDTFADVNDSNFYVFGDSYNIRVTYDPETLRARRFGYDTGYSQFAYIIDELNEISVPQELLESKEVSEEELSDYILVYAYFMEKFYDISISYLF